MGFTLICKACEHGQGEQELGRLVSMLPRKQLFTYGQSDHLAAHLLLIDVVKSGLLVYPGVLQTLLKMIKYRLKEGFDYLLESLERT